MQFLSSTRHESSVFDARERCCAAVGGMSSSPFKAVSSSMETPERFC